MSWTRISIPVASGDAEPLNERFDAAGALAVSFEDAGDSPQFEPGVGETPLWAETIVTGLFAEELDTAALVAQLGERFKGAGLAEVTLLTDGDLEVRTMQVCEPSVIGERIWVGPEDAVPPPQRDIIIRLAPGLAFGTGRHPTTALCLAGLERQVSPGDTVVDLGCGSGILAIAALQLGAHHVWGIDIEPQALVSTQANARQNGVSERLTVGDSVGCVPRPVAFVVANILSQPLIELAPDVARLVRPDGMILLSGLLHSQRTEVQEAYEPWFSFVTESVGHEWCQEGWGMLTAKRHSAPAPSL